MLDIDLRQPGVRVRVVAEDARPDGGAVYGNAHGLADWCARTGAIGGVNGGYFGLTRGDRKQVIGLLATDGAMRSVGTRYRARGGAAHLYARSVLAFGRDGTPAIVWATSSAGGGQAGLTRYAGPVDAAAMAGLPVESAVACGPRLIRGGRIEVADHAERLVSPGKLSRTLVGYTTADRGPSHLLLCIADRMTYQDAAEFLQAYCHTYHNTDCAEAMCLDGGSSSQLVYREGTGYHDAQPTRVTVPTAVVVMARKVLTSPK